VKRKKTLAALLNCSVGTRRRKSWWSDTYNSNQSSDAREVPTHRRRRLARKSQRYTSPSTPSSSQTQSARSPPDHSTRSSSSLPPQPFLDSSRSLSRPNRSPSTISSAALWEVERRTRSSADSLLLILRELRRKSDLLEELRIGLRGGLNRWFGRRRRHRSGWRRRVEGRGSLRERGRWARVRGSRRLRRH